MVYLARVQLASQDRRWVMWDNSRVMPGWIGESARKLGTRWMQYFGETTLDVHVHKGVVSPAELKAYIALVQTCPTGEVN